MVVEDKLSAIIDEQFRRFRQEKAEWYTCSDEELDRAAKELGVRSLTGARFAVYFHLFTKMIEQTARWN